MSTDHNIAAVDELGRRFEMALSAARPRRRRSRRFAAAAGIAVVAIAAPALGVSGAFQFGEATPAPGEPGGPPPVLTGIPDNETVDVLAVLAKPGSADGLTRLLAAHDVRLKLAQRPVAPAAEGRLFGMTTSQGVRFDDRHRIVLGHGSHGTITVDIGRRARPGEYAGTAGLSLYDVLPQVKQAVVRDDPRGSVERLRALGFSVRLMHIIDNPRRAIPGAGPTGWRKVQEVPEGTVVLSVLNADGGSNSATAQTRDLLMELAPAGSDIARGHEAPAG